MDIDTLIIQFTNAVERFLHKVDTHALGDDPARLHATTKCLENLTAIWQKTILIPMNELVRINDVAGMIECITTYAASIDVTRIAEQMNVSDTSRRVMAQIQRDILDLGSKMSDALSALANNILKNKPLDIPDMIRVVKERVVRDEKPIGSVFSRMIRRYAPLMTPEARDAMREIMLGNVIDRMLRVIRIPIDHDRPIYEQVLTSGSLVPLTRSMSRNALFEIFNSHYDMSRDVQSNLARIATENSFNVVLSSKITRDAFEFDGRSLFDFAFIKKNDLIVPKFLGLCDKTLRRFDTLRQLSESKAVVPNYFYHSSDSASKTLVLESLTGNLFRIMGDTIFARGEGAAKQNKGDRDARDPMFLTENAECTFLVRGQSNRASQYHRRAEESIFGSDSRPNNIRAFINTYQASGTDMVLADSLQSHVSIRLREYLRAKVNMSTNVPGDMFNICIESLREIIPAIKGPTDSSSGNHSRSRHTPESLAPFFTKLFKLATQLAIFIMPFYSVGISDDHYSAEYVADHVMQSASDEDLFTISESVNMAFTQKSVLAQ